MIDVPWKLHAHMGAHRVESLHHVCGSDAVEEQREQGKPTPEKVVEEAGRVAVAVTLGDSCVTVWRCPVK
jgi:hypothetical protein